MTIDELHNVHRLIGGGALCRYYLRYGSGSLSNPGRGRAIEILCHDVREAVRWRESLEMSWPEPAIESTIQHDPRGVVLLTIWRPE